MENGTPLNPALHEYLKYSASITQISSYRVYTEDARNSGNVLSHSNVVSESGVTFFVGMV